MVTRTHSTRTAVNGHIYLQLCAFLIFHQTLVHVAQPYIQYDSKLYGNILATRFKGQNKEKKYIEICFKMVCYQDIYGLR